MRVSTTVATLIRANIRYFSRQGYESPEMCERVNQWLAGIEDKEVQEKVISWLQSDAGWTGETRPAILRRYWYLSPALLFVWWHVHRRLLWWAKKLQDSS